MKPQGSQPRLAAPIPHDHTLGQGGIAPPTQRPSVSSTGTFGHSGGETSSNLGLALAQPLLGRPGHVSGLGSLDVAPPPPKRLDGQMEGQGRGLYMGSVEEYSGPCLPGLHEFNGPQGIPDPEGG